MKIGNRECSESRKNRADGIWLNPKCLCISGKEIIIGARKTNIYRFEEDYVVGTDVNGVEFKIDYDDYEKVSEKVWRIDKNGYVISSRGNNGKAMKLHRFVMGVVDNPDVEIDHVSWDLTDNRKANLRLATRSQNCTHRRIGRLNTSGCVGVYKMHGYDKWCVQINVDGKRFYLGSYDSKEEAVRVRKEAEVKMHGDFATN